MKMFIRLGFILLAVSAIATALLAYVNSITEPKIKELRIKEAEAARSYLIPDAAFTGLTIIGEDSLYVAKDKETGQIKGYTFTAAKSGYSSVVKTMAAIDPDFKLLKIKVTEQAETPGLGANCTQNDFAACFENLNAGQLLVDKDGGSIRSLTGATITSRAIANSLQEQIAEVKKYLDSRQTEVRP
ncbi:MAG: FMN-binding protein [Candidatus Cloacimonetes bacterium]|nr:FMN-binding protein [Candidatus Cloacimonadota bacterium]